jgi:iron complex outermembrane recepter protein
MTVASRASAARTRLTIGTSVRAIGIAMLIGMPVAAHAQISGADSQSTQTPTANPTAPAAQASVNASVDPTPSPDQAAEQANTVAQAGGDIVVTGIRASIASSARIKKNATLIVDSVSAEDIGKLPDVSIADSLARLPGVTAQRLEGRDQRLSIRGLGPDFSTTLLNGREQVTVGDNRGVEFDQYPSEFFKNVNVYKSADASLIAAGIAGTIDLRMLRPLDQRDRTVVVSARGQMNGIDKLNPDGSRYGYRASATYVDKFADDTFGVAIGLSATQTPSQDERYNAWGYPNASQAGGNLILGGAKPYVQSNKLNRYGAVATLEYQPNENFHSTFDALYSHFEETQRLRGIEFPINPDWAGSATGTTSIQSYSATNGFVTNAVITNVQAVQRNDLNQRKADNYSFGWNNDFKLADTLHLNVDASWSHASRTDFLLETYTGAGYNGQGVKDTITISQNADNTFRIVPTLNYADTSIFKLTDPRGWGYNGTTGVVQAGFLNRPSFKDDLKSLRASLNGEFGGGSVIKGWEAGANYSRRKKTSAYTSYFLCPKGGDGTCLPATTPTSVAVPSEALLGKNVALDYLGVPQMLTLDPLYVYNNLLQSSFDNRPDSLARDNTVTEDVLTGYAKINIDGLVAGRALKGAVGVQVVRTNQRSSGRIASLLNGAVTLAPASDRAIYTNVLPSATLSYELSPNFFVKAGASQTMVRPRLDQERVTQAVSINIPNIGLNPTTNPVFSSNGGNVQLRPYQSTNYDLSIEKYFSDGGYVAVAGYIKSLRDFVDPNNSYAYDFTSLLPALTPAQQARVIAAGQTTGLVSAPANTGSGYVHGVEATASLPFKLFTSALDGFGIFASGTYTDSSIKLASNPGQAITLPGLSDWVASGTAYFEKNGFQARVNYRYRSSFLGEVAGLSAAPTFRQVKAEAILDAQIGYEFQEGPMKGLAVLVQAKNLTDRPFITYQNDDPRQVIDYQRYGRDYYIGLTYKF